MTDPVRLAVIYYSSTGTVHSLALEAARAGEAAGAAVRLRKVAELAPREAVASNPVWAQHLSDTEDVPTASTDDLVWADGILFGTPTRYGSPAAQLKQFIDMTGPLWQRGALADKVYGAFTATGTAHGGHESTLMNLATVFHHWGGVIVPPGYTDPALFRSGNPYGTSVVAGQDSSAALVSMAVQTRRVLAVAGRLKRGSEVPAEEFSVTDERRAG